MKDRKTIMKLDHISAFLIFSSPTTDSFLNSPPSCSRSKETVRPPAGGAQGAGEGEGGFEGEGEEQGRGAGREGDLQPAEHRISGGCLPRQDPVRQRTPPLHAEAAPGQRTHTKVGGRWQHSTQHIQI